LACIYFCPFFLAHEFPFFSRAIFLILHVHMLIRDLDLHRMIETYLVCT
jgi:hypothetical protein